MSQQNSLIADLVINCAPYLTCGVDLEFVGNGSGESWLELADTRISLELLDIENFRDYVLALQSLVGEFPDTPETTRKIAFTSKWLVSISAKQISKSKIAVYLASEMIVTGDLKNDARSLAAYLDSLYLAKQELDFS